MKGLKYVAAGLSGVLFISLCAGCAAKESKDEGAVSYVGIDVNPSVSLVLDKDNKVVSVIAENEDAQVLLYGEASLVGMSAEDAAKKIAELSVRLGYLGEDNHGVNITVEGKANAEKLTDGIEAAFTASAEGLELNFSSEGTFSINRELKAVNAEYNLNLSVGKFKLILEAQAADKTLTVDAAADMDVSELLDIVASAAETMEPYATEAYNTAKTAAETPVSDTTLDAIAAALDMTEEEKAAFIADVAAGGKTVAALDKYFDVYFKNMTADERKAAEEKMNEVTAKVQAEADKIDAAIAQEYKGALNRLCKDLTALIPDSILGTANVYLTEFKALVNDVQKAADGKEPMAAAYAAKEAIAARSEKVMEAMKADLTQEEVDGVNAATEKLQDTLSSIEKTYNDALAKAEQTAKEYLASLKEERTKTAS